MKRFIGITIIIFVFLFLVSGTIVAAGWKVALSTWFGSLFLTLCLLLGIKLILDDKGK